MEITASNVGKTERALSIMAGTMLTYYAIKKHDRLGAVMALAGAGLMRRGFTGHCEAYDLLGVHTNGNGHAGGIHVSKAVTINKPREEVYRFWRDLSNLPNFMKHLKCVKEIDATTSHWTAYAPHGRTVAWRAEIVSEVENERIEWRSVAGSRIPNSGYVRFMAAPGGRGTEVHVSIRFHPPLGTVGVWAVKVFGQDPEIRIEEDLLRLKAILETGEIPVAGPPEEHHKSGAHKRSLEHAIEESFPASDSPAYR